RGRAGVDLATTTALTLVDSQVTCIPANMHGPLGHNLSALLLGTSSITKRGLFVLPGIIDADFTGCIQILVWTPNPPVYLPEGTKIGQLVPFHAAVPTATNRCREKEGFQSTSQLNIDLVMAINKAKPVEKVTFTTPEQEECTLNMLIDTSADVTIIS
ncbi:POK9 protein, partial [Atlantisia rogersi]|nr:POK9 protein [Atlantisia rogersi]